MPDTNIFIYYVSDQNSNFLYVHLLLSISSFWFCCITFNHSLRSFLLFAAWRIIFCYNVDNINHMVFLFAKVQNYNGCYYNGCYNFNVFILKAWLSVFPGLSESCSQGRRCAGE